MKVLIETSPLIAALVETHPDHATSLRWLERARRREIQGVICAHTLAELYAILTRLPLRQRLSAVIVAQLIESEILANFEVIELTVADYSAVIAHLSSSGLGGGIIYDAILAQAAVKSGAERIITLNAKDFRRAYPGLSAEIVVP